MTDEITAFIEASDKLSNELDTRITDHQDEAALELYNDLFKLKLKLETFS